MFLGSKSLAIPSWYLLGHQSGSRVWFGVECSTGYASPLGRVQASTCFLKVVVNFGVWGRKLKAASFFW